MARYKRGPCSSCFKIRKLYGKRVYFPAEGWETMHLCAECLAKRKPRKKGGR